MLCGNLTVTGDDWGSVTGTYIISEEKSSKSPNKPVYKLQGKDRYIYYNPDDGSGWRVGSKYNAAGAYFSQHVGVPNNIR